MCQAFYCFAMKLNAITASSIHNKTQRNATKVNDKHKIIKIVLLTFKYTYTQ